MNKALFLALTALLLCLFLPFGAVNQMDLIQTMYGEYIGNEFGASLVSMDFNGDGYDDLIVKAPLWHPDNLSGPYYEMYGKVYFYWGGPNFDAIPDFVIEGQYPYHLASYTYTSRENPMINAGDVNGDGIDDLVIPERAPEILVPGGGTRTASVYFGRANPQTTPDVELLYPYPDTNQIYVFPLGDINLDGKSDIAIILIPGYTVPQLSMLIWTDIVSQPFLFRQHSALSNLCGIGDFNGDGYADMVHYEQLGTTRTYKLFYGDSSCSLSDSLLLGIDSVATDRYSTPLGDVNGDGFNDFLSWNDKIWLGGQDINSTPDVVLQRSPMLSFNYGMWPSAVSGDFNNDGYSDLAGADNHSNGNSGMAGIWLGSSEMNGIRDLAINPPENYRYRNFGWGKAAGDFNGDGFCDLAFGAPIFDQGDHWHTEGRVFVYAGNAELIDTTVANDDELIPTPDTADWSIEIYPNPLGKSTKFSVSFIGEAFKRQNNHLEMGVYNLKGQGVILKAIDQTELQSDSLEFDLSHFPAGVYLITIKESGNNKITKKITKY